MKFIDKKLRVVHFPQVGSCNDAFRQEVKDEEQAYLLVNALANQHLWLLEKKIISDYSNVIFVEMLENGEWVDYFNEHEVMEWEEIEGYFDDHLEIGSLIKQQE